MDSKLLSVIIPVHDSARYANSLAEVVMSQTYSRYEIIIVDDGSSDGTASAFRDAFYSCDSVSVIEQDNQGAAIARNRGLACATGDYVMFLDGDDVYHRELFESVVSAMSSSGADMCIFEAAAIDCRNGERNPYISYDAFPQGLYSRSKFGAELFDVVRTVPWNKCFRRSFLVDNNILFQSLPVNNDVCFSASAAIYAEKIYVLRKCLIDYRMYLGESLQDKRGKHPECAIKALEEVWARCSQMIETDDEVFQAFNSLTLNAFFYSFYASINDEDMSRLVWAMFKESSSYQALDNYPKKKFKRRSDLVKYFAIKNADCSSLRYACLSHGDHRDSGSFQKVLLAIKLVFAGLLGFFWKRGK